MLVKAAPEDEYVDKYVSQVFVKSSWEAWYIFVYPQNRGTSEIRASEYNKFWLQGWRQHPVDLVKQRSGS